MATDAESLAEEYAKLREQYSSDLKEAKESQSYQTSGRVQPTEGDLQREASLRRSGAEAESLLSDYQALRWYGTDEEQVAKKEAWEALTDREKSKESKFSELVHMVSAPMYAIAGGVEALTGKGSEEGLANIPANVREREAFGDFLRKFGVSNYVAMPLGLALDIALDPVNWATAGMNAIIPRVAGGAIKGGVKGVAVGLSSNLAKKASTVSKFVPGVAGLSKTDDLAKFASKHMDWYDDIVGNADITKQLPQTRAVQNLTSKFGDFLEKKGLKKPLEDAVSYRPREAIGASMKLEDVLGAHPLVESGEDVARVLAAQEGSDSFIKKMLKHKDTNPSDLVIGEASKAANILADDTGRFVSQSAADNAARLATEANIDREIVQITQKIQEMAQEKTGIRLIDETKEKIGVWLKRDHEKLKPILDNALSGYKVFISNFKIAKVSMSPSAYMNALLGNAVMTKMSGIDLNPKLAGEIKNAFKMVNGGKISPAYMKKFVGNKTVSDFIEKYPRTFTLAFGVSGDIFKDRQVILNKLMKMDMNKTTKAKILDIIGDSDREMQKLLRPAEAGRRAAQGTGLPDTFFSTTYRADVLAGMGDIQQRLIRSLDNTIEQGGEGAAIFAKWYKWFLTQPMKGYESVDQSYKLGIFTHLTSNGISRKEIDILKKMMPIGEKNVDFFKVANHDLYTLSAKKAAEASQEIYMNYGAMPGVVKVLRSTPIMGAPFASFMYAMATKTGKTAAYNPAFFSKMNSLMAEVSGGQDPAERKNLDSMYNAYLNNPGMIKLPMFQQNPVYLRAEQMLPYYSLNIFQPGNRDLDSPTARLITEVTDKVGIMSDPFGQVLLNYFILPAILQDEAPKGMFGNQLYPSDATELEKYVAYPARDIVESQIPPVFGPLGSAFGFMNKQADAIQGDSFVKSIPIPGVGTEEFSPLFRGRQFARAVRGQTSQGVETSEDAFMKWSRVLLSWFGVPLYRSKIYTSDIDKK